MIELSVGQTSLSANEKVQLLFVSYFRTIVIIRLLAAKFKIMFFFCHYSALRNIENLI